MLHRSTIPLKWFARLLSLDSRIFQSAFCVISRHILLDEMEGNLFYEHVQGAWTFSLSILYHHISLSCQLIIRRADFNEHVYVLFVIIILFYLFFFFFKVLTTLGTFFSDILPIAWPFSALVLGLSLFSGLLFMAVLVFIDPVVYAWMVDSLRPASRRIAGADRHRHLNHHHHHHHQRSPVTSESATLEPNLIAPMKIGKRQSF